MTTLKIETREQFEAWLESRGTINEFDPDETLYSEKEVRALYAALRPCWVPVSERLPGTNDLYLCMTIDDMGLVVPYVVSFFEGKFESNELRAVGGMVTHWMLLPPLPEES